MSVFVVTLVALLLVQAIVPNAATKEREIAYDDGTPGGSVSLPYTPTMWSGGVPEKGARNVWIGNHMLAVRFNSDNSTVQMLTGMRFYIMGDLENFNVWAFDSGREFFLISWYDAPRLGSQAESSVHSWTVTPLSTGWVDLNVMDLSNPIFVSGDYYLAIEFTTAHKPSLGVDTTSPRTNRSWLVENETEFGWIPYSTYAEQHELPDGNLMIRALVEPVFDGANATTNAGVIMSSWEPAAVSAAILLVALVSAVGIWRVKKRR